MRAMSCHHLPFGLKLEFRFGIVEMGRFDLPINTTGVANHNATFNKINSND
jgi:hypothetical protein